MNMNSAGKKIIAVCAFLAVSVFAQSAHVMCECGPASVTGGTGDVNADKEYEGQWIANGVTLSISGPLRPGGGTATMNFIKRECRVSGGYFGKTQEKRQFSPLKSKDIGSFCQEQLMAGSLLVWKKTDSHELAYEVYAHGGKLIESGCLSR